jgi:zinc D-Ala-D-Ala carboxypeptidase
MEIISEHITYKEAVHSDTAKRLGLDNTPNGGQIERMKTLAIKVFEPLRNHVGVPIHIGSFFRSLALNTAIGGAKDSQHTTGEAMDIDAEKYGGTTNKELFEYIKDNLEFDQLIWEFGTDTEPDWVHVSFTYKHPNRKEILKAVSSPYGTLYTPYKN